MSINLKLVNNDGIFRISEFRVSETRLSILKKESSPTPISSFTNESSVFYNPKQNKVFSKRFNLKIKR